MKGITTKLQQPSDYSQIVEIYKPVGKTPYEMVRQYREDNSIPNSVKIGYAGRLDPMADGVLVLMIGKATKEQKKLLKKNKVYEFTALLGFATDSYDLLGIVQEFTGNSQNAKNLSHAELISKDVVSMFTESMLAQVGKFTQKYPPFSAYLIKGKPMHALARTGELAQIPENKFPSRRREIFSIKLIDESTISLNLLREYIYKYIPYINGYFRQDDVLAKWDDVFKQIRHDINASGTLQFPLLRFRAHVSSGTFIRSLVHETGQKVGVPALAISITRTKVGM